MEFYKFFLSQNTKTIEEMIFLKIIKKYLHDYENISNLEDMVEKMDKNNNKKIEKNELKLFVSLISNEEFINKFSGIQKQNLQNLIFTMNKNLMIIEKKIFFKNASFSNVINILKDVPYSHSSPKTILLLASGCCGVIFKFKIENHII
jgi:hypothetical protein